MQWTGCGVEKGFLFAEMRKKMKMNIISSRRKKNTMALICLAGVLFFSDGYAQTDSETGSSKSSVVTIEGMKVTDTENDGQEKDSLAGTTEYVSQSTIATQGGGAQVSPYKAISTVPGVDIRSYDPYGMEVSHRIRGKSDRNIGETLEGLPLKGIGPGVGLSTMVDLENVGSISVEKGAVAADSGLGYGSDNGMVDMNIAQSSEEMGGTLKQSFGSNNFSRGYARLETGNINNIAKAFFSGSVTSADKWKGEGKSPDGRENYSMGISSTADQTVQWHLNGIYNEDHKNGYSGLSYEETLNLSENYENDYNTELTGDPDEDSDYYDFNRQDFTTYTITGQIETPVPGLEDASLTLRPYFLNDEGHRYSASSGTLTDWYVEHDTYGTVLEYEQKVGAADLKAGYWYGIDEPPGPPTAQKQYTISEGNAALVFKKWSKLIEATDNSRFNSPYLTAGTVLGAFEVKAGLRYLWWSTPSLKSYNTSKMTGEAYDVSYEQALSMATDTNYHVEGSTYTVFLPNFGATYTLSDDVALRASYGRNYNTPQYGLGSKLDSFYKKGYTEEQLQEIWSDKVRPEESDNFDLGADLLFGNFSLESTLFYSLSKYVAGNFYDPILDDTYAQNSGKTCSYGLEMAMGYSFADALNANLSMTYNKYEFTENFDTATSYTVQAKGHQIPETPLFMANMTLQWNVGEVTVSPTIRYLGERYADVGNTSSMDDYTLVDMDASWKIVSCASRDMTLKFSVTNLLDKKYICSASASDQSTDKTTISYKVGPPITFLVALQIDI
jgi:iron complex outermembrane receptor protein